MDIISNSFEFFLDRETAVAIGKFDGVHQGHRRLLDEIIELKSVGCVLVFLLLILHRRCSLAEIRMSLTQTKRSM